MAKLVKGKIRLFIFLFLFLLFFIVFIVILFVISAVNNDDLDHLNEEEEEGEEDTNYNVIDVSSEITRYEKYFNKYAEKYFISEHVDVLMAISMQESGGRHLDVMQSSESIGLAPNAITDPEESIEIGVKYFAQVLDEANGDLKLSLQSYNFGTGFIDYANERGGYSKDVAVDFSNMMAQKMNWSSYGDVNYVDNVMRYIEENDSNNIKSGDWALPLEQVTVTSGFGARVHPITGENSFHGGIDFDCSPVDNIMAVKGGEVVESVHSNVGYGNYVIVEHGSNEFSRYAHMSVLNVSLGEKVDEGAILGKCGTTGSSTGNHLHLEYMTNISQVNEDKIDPIKILGLD